MLTLHAESMTTPTLYTALSEQLIDCVMSELPALISDADLHISQHVLTLLCVVMDTSPSNMASVSIILYCLCVLVCVGVV